MTYAPEEPAHLECGHYNGTPVFDEPIYVVIEESRTGPDYYPLFWSTDRDLVHNFIEKNETADTALTFYEVKKLVEW